MLEISNVNLPLDAGLPDGSALLYPLAAAALGVEQSEVRTVCVLKRSVDARKKLDVHFVATLGVDLVDGRAEERALVAAQTREGNGILLGTHIKAPKPYEPRPSVDLADALAQSGEPRPCVVGAGPAGLFAALFLARAGLRPIVIERGGDCRERVAAVAQFNQGGPLDLSTNIQFGEGGAGTFSDGKLTTNTKNPLTREVLSDFALAGAPEEILTQAKPHIGTDRLVSVVQNLREAIEAAGGEVRFHTQLVDVRFDGGVLVEIDAIDTLTGKRSSLPARRLVLATGHSARDTFEALHGAGLVMEQKPFSVGVRIEHSQQAINVAQYGAAAKHPALGAAEYQLAAHLESGRGVYTFCMCPGGDVVCAASEEGGVVVNGMSRFARDGENANSALLVGVGPEDFGSDHPLAGIEFQRRIESAAYQAAIAAGGTPQQAPAQTVGDFVKRHQEAVNPSKAPNAARDTALLGKTTSGAASLDVGVQGKAASGIEAKSSGLPSATVRPTYARGVVWCDLHDCLPPFVTDALVEALPLLDRKLRGFAAGDAVMTGVETRSSSPVRIVRGAGFQASLCNAAGVPYGEIGIYPCGEGAGYAGGIMSAAVDGLRVAEALADGLK